MKKQIIFFLCLSFISGIKAQEKIDQAIKVLEQKYAQEKIYLLFDKEKYITGENIWFKSFIFDGYNRSAISSSLFIELYDRDKNLIDKKIFPITNGESDGSLNLPEKLKEDVYFIRAYTTWMANFSEEFQLIQPILVYNSSSPERLTINTDSQWAAKVYPEGGTFIENIPTKFAVRIHSEGTPPFEWYGYITEKDKPNNKITTFSGMDQNVGLFSITPKKGKNYLLTVEDKNGTKQNIPLPAASSSGINLQVYEVDKGIQYTIKSNNLSGLKGYTVVGTVNNLLAYKATISQNNKEISSTIPFSVNNQMNGVLQITVFDEKENVVAQRLCFLKPDKSDIDNPLIPDSQFNKTARAYNNINILSKDNYSDYTIIVRDKTDLDINYSLNRNNILSTLWLTGDFTSKIYAPAQYFEKNANPKALDALLISEKWKRFDWNVIMEGRTPDIKYKPEPYLSYKGKVTINSRPIPDTSVSLVLKSTDGNSFFYQVQTDMDGYFILNNINFDKPLKISYFLDVEKKEASNLPNLKITFTPLIDFVPYKSKLPTITDYRLSKYQTIQKSSTEIIRAINNQENQKLIYNNEILIDEIQLRTKRKDSKRMLDKKLSNGKFTQNASATIFDFVNEDLNAQAYPNIFMWLQGRLPSLTFQLDSFGNYIPYMRNYKMDVYLDENLIDYDMINNLSISQIAMVKIFKSAGLIGNAIAIYLRTSDMKKSIKTKDPSINNTITITGYDKAIPFYEPDYNKPAYKNIANDTRDVLYWNPKLKLESKNSSTISFYNNDTPKNYQITIIGFDKDDKPLYYNGILW